MDKFQPHKSTTLNIMSSEVEVRIRGWVEQRAERYVAIVDHGEMPIPSENVRIYQCRSYPSVPILDVDLSSDRTNELVRFEYAVRSRRPSFRFHNPNALRDCDWDALKVLSQQIDACRTLEAGS